MIGVKSGFLTLVKNEWPHVTSSHCSLHRYTLALKTLPLHLMDVAFKVINFIRSRAKNHRLFQLLVKEMGAQHVGFLFYIKVRKQMTLWLHKFQNEVEIFLRENKNNLHVQFHKEQFAVMLAYLGDVFGHLNDMN